MGQAQSGYHLEGPVLGPEATKRRRLKGFSNSAIDLLNDTNEAREASHGPFDITLIAKNDRFQAHRQILAEKSAYFRPMLSMFQEQFQSEVEFKELVDPECLAKVLFFLYFNEIYLTPMNAQDILSLANYLQIEGLQRRCSDYMQLRIDKQNCVSLYLYTLCLGPEDLRCHAEDYILSNFEKIVTKKSREFLLLPKELLLKIISNDRLLVSTEGSVFRAVMHWVSFSPKERAPHIPNLLEHVHFPLMSMNEVEQYGRDSRVKKSKNLAIAFEEAKRYFDKDPTEKIRYWTNKKKPGRWPKIFVVMRMYWKNLQSKAKWKMMASMSTARSSHTVEVLDGNIYVVGGGDGKEWLCTSEVYNPVKNKWSLISDLKTKRWKCGLCVLNGYLYAIGGMDSPQAGFWGSPLKSVERYFPATDEWQEVAHMNEARFGAAVVSYQGKVYVSGGFGTCKSILSSTEVYDPDANRWTKINPMRKMCGFVGGVLVDRPIHFDEGDF
ncbi:LOW QUALITY PROTEIN: kelch-like protein diablo [Tigriopus californicus]|uniref:LOW QUALITY PROTEIN: kelch-like protein diablo n=1 Tax=Tigriopus californicus TaxID=6832 RepID=UPI0027DA0041|nr:LOW QUALITY PROTEIN: kelch-like protein diablo [Tigriopus californicus]